MAVQRLVDVHRPLEAPDPPGAGTSAAGCCRQGRRAGSSSRPRSAGRVAEQPGLRAGSMGKRGLDARAADLSACFCHQGCTGLCSRTNKWFLDPSTAAITWPQRPELKAALRVQWSFGGGSGEWLC